MKEPQMQIISENIDNVFKNMDDEDTLNTVKQNMKDLCGQFPIYPIYK